MLIKFLFCSDICLDICLADLELYNIKIIWIELNNSHRRILFSLFWQSPSLDSNYFLNILDSIPLAARISELIATGDYNLNLLNPLTARKIKFIRTQVTS